MPDTRSPARQIRWRVTNIGLDRDAFAPEPDTAADDGLAVRAAADARPVSDPAPDGASRETLYYIPTRSAWQREMVSGGRQRYAVIAQRRVRPSARALRDALRAEGFPNGYSINWGVPMEGEHPYYGASWNYLAASAINKRSALLTLQGVEGVSVPRTLFTARQAFTQLRSWQLDGLDEILIGRPSYHRAGEGWFPCRTASDIENAQGQGATHFTQWIPNARDFRVHIAFGRSIKISERVGAGHSAVEPRNYSTGAVHQFPQNFGHRRTLREMAKRAVEALGLQFGAVDMLWGPDGRPFVLEVNTAPRLTDPNSDTLTRYVSAFMTVVTSPGSESHAIGAPDAGVGGVAARLAANSTRRRARHYIATSDMPMPDDDLDEEGLTFDDDGPDYDDEEF